MQKLLRYVRKFLFWTFFVSLFLLTTIVVVLHIYEDDIKQYAIDEINSHLKTDLEVRNIELSVFHDFPRASLEFDHVLIKDAFENQESEDTMFFSKRVFCTFNLWDIWNGDYKVKRLAAEDSKLNLRVTRDGDVNYDIMKESTDSSESNFKFMLELLRIDRLEFLYSNLATGQYYRIDMARGLAKGDFTADEYQIVSESSLFIRKIKSNSLTLIKYKPAKLDLKLNVNSIKKSYSFTQGDLTIGEMPFEITGVVDSVNVDLKIKGKNIELQQLANSLSAGTQAAKKYKGTGILNFESAVDGPVSSTEMPSITATFDVANGTLTEPVNDLKIYDIQLKGEYQNEQKGREELLAFDEVNLKLLNSFFSGNGSVRNFEQPNVTGQMDGHLDLATFHQFFHFQNVEKISGIVDLNLDFVIQFLDPEYRKDKFSITKAKGNLNLKKVLYKHVNNELIYQDVNGDIVINDNDAAVKDFSIKTNKSDLVLNGALNNLMQYLTGTGSLGMIATLESSHIDLNEFIGESNVNTEETPTKFILPGNLNLNIDLDVKDLLWDEHKFTTISGKLLMANRKATATNFRLQTSGGNVSGNLALNNLVDDGNVIEGELKFNSINVKSLFTEWKNFDQNTITDQHLSGTCSGSVDLLLFFNPYFSIIEEKIYAVPTIEITNGELKGLETMKMITDYMRSNAALKLMLNKHIDKFEEKLLNLKFTQLSNQLEIKDRKIFIPKMKIVTNAVELELFGWHDFDNIVEYHFSFRFRDLKTVAEYTEFGKVVDDGLGIVIYLTMSGSMDDPTYAFDSDERKNDIKENLAQEGQTIKSILKTEFGLFKNDSTVQKMEEANKGQVEFIFYDEDIEESDTTKKSKNKIRTGNLFNKTKQDVEKEKVEIEIDD